MSGGWPHLAVLLAAAPAALPARAADAPFPPDRSIAPVCAVASHERLLLRRGRDICGPTLSRSGRPTATGYLPTACPAPSQNYVIDAAGIADRCIMPPHTAPKREN